MCSQIRHVVVDKISRLTDQKVRPDIPARKSVRKGAGGLLWQVRSDWGYLAPSRAGTFGVEGTFWCPVCGDH